jgi:hypothetical protein
MVNKVAHKGPTSLVRARLHLERLESRWVPSQIDGWKWNDVNGDGAWDPGEPGLGGWTIQLLQNGQVVQTTQTMVGNEMDGAYWLTNIPAGTYSIREVQEAGWIQTYGSEFSFTIGDNDFLGGNFGVAEPFNFGNHNVCSTCSSITSNFNGTPIAAGNYLWLNSVLKASGLGSNPVTIFFNNATIGTADTILHVPNATITFSPTATSATTAYDSNTDTWFTTLPSSGVAGNTFLTGLSFPVPDNIPGGVHGLTMTGCFVSDTPGVTVSWQWAAAAYTQFSTDYNALGIKPVDDDHASQYHNSDHAGTPENFKSFVIGGGTGGGGSNYTGSYSGTAQIMPCTPDDSASNRNRDVPLPSPFDGLPAVNSEQPSARLSTETEQLVSESTTPSLAPTTNRQLSSDRPGFIDGLFATYDLLPPDESPLRDSAVVTAG